MKKNFKIDLSIYSENIINQAISDFSEVSEIFLENDTIKISGENDSQIDEIFNEFMNYNIGLINEN